MRSAAAPKILISILMNLLASTGHTAPSPWYTPTVENGIYNTWGRQYMHYDSVFPSQIVSQGHELLSAPLSLEMVVGGKPVELAFRATDKIHTKSHGLYAESYDELPNFTLSVRMTLEFDGFQRYDITVTPNLENS